MSTVTIEAHPLLDAGVFVARFLQGLSAPSPDWLVALLRPGAQGPLTPDDTIRAAIRDLLRHGGYKPTGRGKPASEYLSRAGAEGKLAPINLAVDACNVVSLHSGLPISVVDLDRVRGPLRIGLAPAGARYVFNASGQEMDLEGIICLSDAEGPCANPVKDSQRTKTSAGSQGTLSIVWGTRALGDRTARAVAWYRELLARAGAIVDDAF